MQRNKLVRYACVWVIKGLLGAILGVSLTITKPALAVAPDFQKEAWQPLEIQTLLERPYADENFKLSEAQEIKFKLYLETQRQGLSYWDYRRLAKVAFCESSFRHEGVYGDKGRAYGVFQFWKSTFDYFASKAQAEEMNYYSMDDQIQLAVYAYKTKQMSHWTCYK